jgi:hypothetical protein
MSSARIELRKENSMDKTNISILGDFIEPESVDFEGALTFTIKASYIEQGKLWKSKDITAEFLGDFWRNILNIEDIKPTLHFVCAELLENAVYHSKKSEYMVMIELCFSSDELLVYVRNRAETEKIGDFKSFVTSILEADNLQKLFIQKMKDAKKTGSKKSQVGLITILKDRGAKLAWKLEQGSDDMKVTTLARIPLRRKDME